MQHRRLKIFNGKIITPHRVIPDGTIVILDDKVVEVGEKHIEVPEALEIDAGGNYISPGFIDIHVHGGGGGDFMDGNEDAFLKIAELHARYGTTSMVPTTLTSDKEDILKTLSVYEKANKRNVSGAQFLGMHLEGPYFAMNQRGAQDPRYIRNPDPEEYKEIIRQSRVIRRWSAAPELEGALAFGRYLRGNNIIAAVAHTDAIYEDVVNAFESGYSLITHLYSGMSGVTRRNAFRYAGVVESAYLIDEMAVELIADGIHLPPPLLKLAYKIKGADKLVLITDAMRAAGMPPGESILGSIHDGIKVIVEDNVAKLPDRSAFAGSVATADRLVRNMITLAGVPLPEAVKMMTSTPATVMEVSETKGSLAPGKDADIVIFDEDIHVIKTIVKGKVIYTQ
ncbi:MAG TPA: N-acetylglucosamine-6-phosphate deacetylase [Chitinophagaceae bacterium]|nr:N-acetylglucosamine-6-phosphate deacetylase [Chitinophagaceae bacterium]